VRPRIAAILLVVGLALAQPARDALRAEAPEAPSLPGAEAPRLAQSVLTGSFRPLLLTYLWLRGDVLYGEGRDEECYELYRVLHALYPANERARDYVGWFLAFNLKQKAPGVALGWKWAESGLDMLVPTPAGPSIVADWILKQCGQNAIDLLRYAGPRWEAERAWRERLARFGARHWGEDLSRFALGVRVLEGRGGFYDRARRAVLLRRLAYEEMLRFGDAPHAVEAVAALREMAEAVADEEDLKAYWEEKARCLETTAAGQVPEPLPESDAYPVAMALLGRGAKEGDARALEAASEILVALGTEEFVEEIDLVKRWRAHLENRSATPRPPLPFDAAR
jgi:hypothetical protein